MDNCFCVHLFFPQTNGFAGNELHSMTSHVPMNSLDDLAAISHFSHIFSFHFEIAIDLMILITFLPFGWLLLHCHIPSMRHYTYMARDSQYPWLFALHVQNTQNFFFWMQQLLILIYQIILWKLATQIFSHIRQVCRLFPIKSFPSFHFNVKKQS